MMTQTSSGYSKPPVDAPKVARGSERSALGELLRSHRERRGLTLQQIAAETKIPLRHLQALEGDNLTAVPAGLYQRAEIRAYARAVRLDAGVALAQLERDLGSAGSSGGPASSRKGESEPSRKHLLLVVGAVAMALVFGFAMQSRDGIATGGVPQGSASEAPSPQAPPAEQPAAAAVPEAEIADAPAQPAIAEAPAQSPPPASAEPTAGSVVDPGAPLVSVPQSELVITTDPPGARVTVDGVGWGETPVTVRHLASGAKRIRVTMGGYQSEERVVPVANARRSTLHVSLRSTTP